MKSFKKVVIASAAAAGTLTAVCLYITNQIMYIKKKPEEQILKEEVRPFFTMSAFDAQTKESFAIESPHGYRIHGYFIPADPPNEKKFMIFCHGVTVNRLASVKYANLFLRRGFNVILFDERRHGKTGGKTTSYGYYEKDDLAAIVHWVKNRFAGQILLGIHGVSMGAATLLQYAGLVEDGADFYIADCPYSDFFRQLHYLLRKDYHLPKWPILPVTQLVLRLRDGYSLRDVSPLAAVRNISHPVLFIHSEKDAYIPAGMTRELYEAKPGSKKLFIPEDGGHACAYAENREGYEKVIDRFLAAYILKKSEPMTT
ncbi:alpha/beta hydrolase [Sporolactobacillus sp. THM7-7]|nr:alpha/beta hydrolase [Sporolactobacillus sp. THM7-7]